MVAQLVKVVVKKRVGRADVGQVRHGRRMGDLVCPTNATDQRVDIVLGGEVAVDGSNRGDVDEETT